MRQPKVEIKIQSCKIFSFGGLLLDGPMDCPFMAENSLGLYCSLRKKNPPTLFIEKIFEVCPFQKGAKNVDQN